MDFKFSKDADPESKQPATEKGTQNSLLLLLLILIGGFAYLYFFTDLIRPQQEQQTAEAPAPQVIKNPLPPPVDQTGSVPAAPAATAVSVTPGENSPKSTPATTAAVQGPKKNTEPPKVDIKGEKKDLSAPAAAPAPPKSSAAKEVKKASSPVSVSEKKPVAAAVTPKIPKAKTAAASGTKTAKASVGKPALKVPDTLATEGAWTVVVGVYTLEDAMATDMVRVRKAGLDASIEAGPRRTMSMNRLYLSEFPERSAALAELNKLKRHTSDAFILDQGRSFAVYAGSYLLDARAASERERLAAAGYPLTLKRVDVSIPTKKLIAGRFSNKQAAEAAFRKLKRAGLKPALTR